MSRWAARSAIGGAICSTGSSAARADRPASRPDDRGRDRARRGACTRSACFSVPTRQGARIARMASATRWLIRLGFASCGASTPVRSLAYLPANLPGSTRSISMRRAILRLRIGLPRDATGCRRPASTGRAHVAFTCFSNIPTGCAAGPAARSRASTPRCRRVRGLVAGRGRAGASRCAVRSLAGLAVGRAGSTARAEPTGQGF